MENNNCCNHDHHGVNVCVHVDGCTGDEKNNCACVPTLEITIGKCGQFATLTEALEYAGTVAHNSLVIEMVSDVTETRTGTMLINGFGYAPETAKGLFPGIRFFVLKGNGYVLNLNSITDGYCFNFYAGAQGWIDDITILAGGVKSGAIAIGQAAFLHVRKDVKLVGNPSSNTIGYNLYWDGHLGISYGKSVLENFKHGILAAGTSVATVVRCDVTFTNVTTNYSPAPNTVGNNNAYIYVE